MGQHELTMLDRLAVLIHRRRRRFLWGSLVVVLAAGFFGGPVFGLLDSGDDFDDPQAEAVLAARDVERATGASASPDMVALVRLGAPADSAQGQDKLARVAAAFRDRGIASVGRYERGGDRALVSEDGRSSYVVATFRIGRRGRARPRAGPPGAHTGGDRRRRRARRGAGRRAGLRGHRARRAARVPDPLPAVVLRLPQPRGGAAPARGRRRDDHALVPGDAVRQRRDRADVDLRAEPDHRPRARPRDRLLAVHGLALPRGARARARHRRRAAQDDGHGGPHGAVLLDHRRGGARLAARVPAALPLLDGRRRRDLRARRGARVADAAAGDPRRARPARERAEPAPLPGGAAPRGLRRARRLLVPALASRHAPPRADRGRRRRAADRARAPVPRRQVHRRRRERAPARPVGAGRRRRDRAGVPAQPHEPDLHRGARRPGRPRGDRALRAAARRAAGRRRSSRRCSPRTASTGSTSSAAAGRSASRRRSWCATSARSTRRCPCASAGRPPGSSTSRRRCRTRCRSRWRSSRRRRSSSCS